MVHFISKSFMVHNKTEKWKSTHSKVDAPNDKILLFHVFRVANRRLGLKHLHKHHAQRKKIEKDQGQYTCENGKNQTRNCKPFSAKSLDEGHDTADQTCQT